jgi:hypothetical protein
MGKALSDAQIRQFHDRGYVFSLPCLSSAEARRFRDRFEAYERTIGESAHRRLRIKARLAFPWLVELARHPRILDAVEDILGRISWSTCRRSGSRTPAIRATSRGTRIQPITA